MSALTRLCDCVVRSLCGGPLHVYCPSHCDNSRMGFVVGEWVGVYDIMGYEGALYVPSCGAFLVLEECIVERCVVLVLLYSLSL